MKFGNENFSYEDIDHITALVRGHIEDKTSNGVKLNCTRCYPILEKLEKVLEEDGNAILSRN